MKNEKNRLRDQMRLLRCDLESSEKRALDIKIARNLAESDLFKQAKSILIYASAKSEVNTKSIIKKALSLGKKTALPVVKDGVMAFYEIESLDGLVPGSFKGISEPDTSKCKKADAENYDICIVPAFCFDKKGYRIGYGGGYYDKFLPGFSGTGIGLCYNKCFFESIPHESFDIAVNYIVNENGVIKIADRKYNTES